MSETTPMMKQYLETKKKVGDAILFFRLGDFYEMFGDDAKTASSILQIALTARSAGEGRSVKMPMCGVPFHAANSYILKLISHGYKVAICEQVEDPKDAKGLVKREVIKVVTPGTVLEESALDKKSNNYLMSMFMDRTEAALAYVDLTTGEFRLKSVGVNKGYDRVIDEIEKTGPAEMLLPDTYNDDKDLSKNIIERLRSGAGRICLNLYPSWNFQEDTAAENLKDHFKVSNLAGFGMEGRTAQVCAAGALMRYLTETQKTFLHHINRISQDSADGTLYIDAVSLKNLEIIETGTRDARYATVYSVLDHTQTAMGARELKKWLKSPLTDTSLINERLDTVGHLADNPQAREKLKAVLSEISDIERISGKLGSQAVNARDLNALKKGLKYAMELEKSIAENGNAVMKKQYAPKAKELKKAYDLIDSAIVEEPPISVKEGGMIKPGYSAELKELKEATSGGREWIAALQESERKATGISSLKVGYTSVFGYYIEVSKANLKSVPAHYIRKQTMVNAERFITPELKEREALILGAQEKMTSMEYEIFCGLREELIKEIPALQLASARIAGLDCLLSLAEAAVANNYVRPVVDSSDELLIAEGRHPVVEKSLGFNEFIPNNCGLNRTDEMVMVITGPNMAGKSTYMRQVAVLALMAQAGSFVPAKSAKIGVVDKIFTRVGAADYLARGQSTFMVEMIETANILNNATERSLILLDEVGRGTSTFDGVSIAWAITEYIHNKVRARTLFATHYYELTEIADNLPGVVNYNIQVKEWGEKIIFLRKIIKGSTDRSYGIHVAQLAGLPGEVTERATSILGDLEKANYTKEGKPKIGAQGTKQPPQTDLFSFAGSELQEALKRIKVDEMTPVEALLKLKELKDKYS